MKIEIEATASSENVAQAGDSYGLCFLVISGKAYRELVFGRADCGRKGVDDNL